MNTLEQEREQSSLWDRVLADFAEPVTSLHSVRGHTAMQASRVMFLCVAVEGLPEAATISWR